MYIESYNICNKKLTLDVLRSAASFAELSGVLVARRSFEALCLSDLARRVSLGKQASFLASLGRQSRALIYSL